MNKSIKKIVEKTIEKFENKAQTIWSSAESAWEDGREKAGQIRSDKSKAYSIMATHLKKLI